MLTLNHKFCVFLWHFIIILLLIEFVHLRRVKKLNAILNIVVINYFIIIYFQVLNSIFFFCFHNIFALFFNFSFCNIFEHNGIRSLFHFSVNSIYFAQSFRQKFRSSIHCATSVWLSVSVYFGGQIHHQIRRHLFPKLRLKMSYILKFKIMFTILNFFLRYN